MTVIDYRHCMVTVHGRHAYVVVRDADTATVQYTDGSVEDVPVKEMES